MIQSQTNDQIALILLLKGTEKQQKEAIFYLAETRNYRGKVLELTIPLTKNKMNKEVK